jgi:hypothetical protein
MKRLLLCVLFIPFAVKNKGKTDPTSTNLVQVRTGDWPISLDRTVDNADTSYLLQFRNEQVLTEVAMDTLPFPDLGQLKYFQQALSVLKTGNNGDIAKFKTYTLSRADKKYEGSSYILRLKWGSTDFHQPEADLLIGAIKKL